MSGSLHLSHIRKWLLQSPPAEWVLQHVRELLLGALRQGKVPRHVAFVMDGNRRFARNHQIEVIEGHNIGFEALARILEVCYKIGVRTVTIYAFSIENFKRSKYEVDALMDMAKVKLSQLAQHGELLERYGAKLQFLGQRDMIRPDVLAAIDKAIALTKDNGHATLNICAPYTSRDEITTAIRNTVVTYSQPNKPRLKRPFSESHIARTIRAQKLSTVSEDTGVAEVKDSESTAAQEPTTQAEENVSYAYKPSNPKSRAAFHRITDLVTKNMHRTIKELEASVAQELALGAAGEVLALLKTPSMKDNEQQSEINELLATSMSSEDFANLVGLAEQITDFTAIPGAGAEMEDQERDLRSSPSTTSITLGGNASERSASQSPSQTQPQNYPDPELINAATLTAHTFTGADTPPLDILIRTSGVERLSDFMLWQCHQETEIVFLECMWPEFDLWQFLPVLLEWQWRRRKSDDADEAEDSSAVGTVASR